MFTGIIQAVGVIVRADDFGFGKRLTVEAPALGLADVAIGDSIAINGACMTVTSRTDRVFTVDVSAESLVRTVGLAHTGEVNLEKGMRLGDRVDGHLVSGHVDGTGVVIAFEPHGESTLLIIEAPADLARFFAYKGSVTVNGVSLTVNRVEDMVADGARTGCRIWINLIPHTTDVTTLGRLKAGDRVNLEVDQIARYCERMLSLQD